MCLYTFLTFALDWGGWSMPLRIILLSETDPVPIVREPKLGGLQSRPGGVRNISPPLAFDPRTVSHYTYYAGI
jgi:hypothetical protein